MATYARAAAMRDVMRGALTEAGRPDLVDTIGVQRVGKGWRPATATRVPEDDLRISHRAFLVARGNRADGYCFECWLAARTLPVEDRRARLRDCDHRGRHL